MEIDTGSRNIEQNTNGEWASNSLWCVLENVYNITLQTRQTLIALSHACNKKYDINIDLFYLITM